MAARLGAAILALTLLAACGRSKGSVGVGSGGSVGSGGGPTSGTGGAGTGSGGAGTGGASGASGAAGGGAAGGGAGSGGLGLPSCGPGITHGASCDADARDCMTEECVECSDMFWRWAPRICGCGPDRTWACGALPPGGPIPDCFFDPPLSCPLAEQLFTERTCTVHPPCSGDR